MDRLPAELLVRIFTLATTDGGATSRSLALVSKEINDASRPVRFNSVSLNGSRKQIQALLAHLKAEHDQPSHYPPHVHHLFLVCTKHLWARREQLKHDGSEQSRVWTVVGRTYENSAQQAEYCTLITSLLFAVAPRLETLSVVMEDSLGPYIIFPSSFPALRELSIREGSLAHASETGEGPAVRYPALRRLHWRCDRFRYPSSTETLHAQSFMQCAPGLTHLRISNFGGGAIEGLFQQLLRPPGICCSPWTAHIALLLAAVGIGEPEAPAPQPFSPPKIDIPPQLRGLKQVVIQPTPFPSPGGYCGNAYVQHAEGVAQLWYSLASASLPVYLFPARVEGSDSLTILEQLRAEWLERLEGGEGCWAVKERWARASQLGDDCPKEYFRAQAVDSE